MKLLRAITVNILLLLAIPAFAGPTYPDGRDGVILGSNMSKSVHVEVGKVIVLQYRYNALKENWLMIYDVLEGKNLATLGNIYGSGKREIILYPGSIEKEYIITGYSKDCNLRNNPRGCSDRGWAQQPYKKLGESYIGFEDSPVGDDQEGSYDDIQVDWRNVNIVKSKL